MIAREYPELRVRYAKSLRAARERATMAKIYRQHFHGIPVFPTLAQMLCLAFASEAFIMSEIEWLKNYEQGEFNAETEE